MVGEVKGWGYARQDIVDRGLAVVLAMWYSVIGDPPVCAQHAGDACIGSPPPGVCARLIRSPSYRGRWGQGSAQVSSAVFALRTHTLIHTRRQLQVQRATCIET